MSDLASVHPLDGPSRAEQVRDNIIDLIECGAVLPGQELSVSEIADRSRVRVDALARSFRALADRELFEVTNDRIVVAPLPIDSLRRALELRRDIESHLLDRAAPLLSPGQLRRLSVSLPDPADPTITQLDFSKALASFEHRLHAPGGTGFELRLLGEVFALGRRFICLANRGIDAGLVGTYRSEGAIRQNCIDISRETLSILASGNLRSLPELRRLYQADYEELAQLAADLDLSRLSSPLLAESPDAPNRQPARVIELHPQRRSG